ncbi:MAG: phosphate signaling complex protein PhoU [Candidatus Eisenbacteria bacterium]|uniref:Phosphate-specific transport system accessory protein PhoU n=1 Tax=Eiseniibacteriota bacterium TaxID=2212470 RepID=A0A933SEK7_UNCEI|nr:phosphate signaling complex protein PhoU [Candidatus Eisenbacteria bacterium]
MSRHFEELVNELNDQLLLMSGRVESIIRKAVEALQRRDVTLAEEVFRDDRAIDRMEMDIEERCIELLALQQPLARDLRLITSALKISNDLERVGDHAVNIAGCAKTLDTLPPMRNAADLPELAEKAIGMLREALDAFVRRDADAARALVRRDDEVDALNRHLFAELLARMVSDPAAIQASMALVLVGRNLERIGDLATNVAEEVVFIAEARVIKHHAEDPAVRDEFGRS